MSANAHILRGTAAPPSGSGKADSRAPQGIDRLLAVVACILLLAVLAALYRGRDQWSLVPSVVWAHLATILIAVSLTPVMLLRRRGDRTHRLLGWLWAASLFLTAVISFWVRTIRPGHFSLIHVLSAFTLVQVPLIVLYARLHQWKRHRAAVRGMITGALLIAGFFTFPFGRLLGRWLLG